MTPTTDRPLKRICVRVLKDDLDVLEEFIPGKERGLNRLMRGILHNYVLDLQARAARIGGRERAYQESLQAIGIEPRLRNPRPMEL